MKNYLYGLIIILWHLLWFKKDLHFLTVYLSQASEGFAANLMLSTCILHALPSVVEVSESCWRVREVLLLLAVFMKGCWFNWVCYPDRKGENSIASVQPWFVLSTPDVAAFLSEKNFSYGIQCSPAFLEELRMSKLWSKHSDAFFIP